jgi:DNA-binding Lrp family transcriptional regulator
VSPFVLVGLALLSTGVLAAQTPASTEVTTPKWDPLADAQKEIERLRTLEKEGVIPRRTLEIAEKKLAEAQDEQILNRTLYGKVDVDQLTPEQTKQMIEAAQRRVDRQQAEVNEQQKLIDEGVKARLAVTPFLEELDTRRRTLDLAHARAKLFDVLAELARVEANHVEDASAPDRRLAVRFDGKGSVREFEISMIEKAFEQRFGYSLPVSARGETAVHKSLGFDHRGRLDVAVNPDQPEGVWLRKYLENSAIPYFAFRGAVPGKATGAHIHIGPPSTRLVSAD